MTTVYQPTRVVWPPQPQPYYPRNPMYDGLSSSSSSRRHERRESLRRAEQVRADEALARRMQAEEEQLLVLESMRTAQRERDQGRQPHHSNSMAINHDRDRTRTASTASSSRSSTPRPRPSSPLPVPPRIMTPSPARSAPKTPAEDQLELREHTHSKSPRCQRSRCGTLLPVAASPARSRLPSSSSSHTHALSAQLHLTCPRCSTTHCLGCSRPVSCPPHCPSSSSSSCALPKCCPPIRALAIFHILSAFDDAYLSACSSLLSAPGQANVPAEHRTLFLEYLTSNSDTRFTKAFNRTFLHTLLALRPWLSSPSPFPAPSPSSSPLPPTPTPTPPPPPSIPTLLSTSFLLEVARAYLADSTRNHVHWVIHGELYVALLALLVLLGRSSDPALSRLVMRPLQRRSPPSSSPSSSSGVQACVSASTGAFIEERKAAEGQEGDEEGGEEEEQSLSLYALAGKPRVRADLRKMEGRGDKETQSLVAQLLMDLNHIVCMDVLG
ncbi:hypothetical protein LshimejAT787_1402700 [Lyophyllum shimeji]|uniref:Uncharacterized protein n=1 Tax=Lyophyllum shimeji TaxID=47721 RepID=A0A9P3PY78_LYOSH|nr:hypothetical protein LshimejAT787_1402700 [Lyophyllum shimeji]